MILPTKVLVIDDHASVRKAIELILKQKGGYQVFTASSIDEALVMADEDYFRLIITEVMMPGIGGVGLAYKLRQLDKYQDTSFIAMSSLAPEIIFDIHYESADISWFNGFIAKPFSPEQLHSVLASVRIVNREIEDWTEKF